MTHPCYYMPDPICICVSNWQGCINAGTLCLRDDSFGDQGSHKKKLVRGHIVSGRPIPPPEGRVLRGGVHNLLRHLLRNEGENDAEHLSLIHNVVEPQLPLNQVEPVGRVGGREGGQLEILLLLVLRRECAAPVQCCQVAVATAK